MLGRAVQDHHPGLPGIKGTTLSQHYANANAHPLKPLPASALNTTFPAWPQTGKSLKRTTSQANGIDEGYYTQEHLTKKRTMVDLAQPSADRVGKLHETVLFDENDFDDDANIDLDEDVSPALSKDAFSLQSSRTLLPDSIPKKTAAPHTPVSSTPIPWSSSPLSHHQMPPPVSLPLKASSDASAKVPSKEAPTVNATKRRTLPWAEEEKRQEQERLAKVDRGHENLTGGYLTQQKARGVKSKERRKASGSNRLHEELAGGDPNTTEQPMKRYSGDRDSDLDGKGMPEFVKEKIKEARGERAEAKVNFTPLPKDRGSSRFPWNTTASAVKQQQKELRQGQRKVKNFEGDEVTKSNQKKKREAVAKVFLSEEQRSVLDLVSEKRKSVFFTGSAGTGKSVLLREIIKVVRDKHKHEQDRVAVTASTGLAACNVGGVTLHSFAGIGLGKEAVPELVRKIKRNQKAKLRWLRTKVLIVDEISMVDGDLFDKLESIARSIRNNGRPFGGIQLVITGDFFQLPPVPDYGKVAKFSFDAATWNTSIEHTIGLTQVFRQKDPVFANMLNEMRLGRLTPKSIDAFRALNRPLSFGDDFEATELFPTRNEVDSANNTRMRNLAGSEHEFRAEDGGSILDHEQRTKLLANCMAPPSISLKKGAQVMLIKNLDETLVNGSVGKVIAFMDEKTFSIYDENEDEFQAVETMDLDDEEMTKSRKKLKALISKNLAGDTSQKWPLVRFAIADGSSRDLLCQRESWKIELPNGEVQASRSQIPLILAWALSIHKAQGQTLDRVKVDLGKIFEKGQAYVALSRATCQEGLQITRFDPKKVMAHDRVRTFYDSLYSINEALNSKALGGGTKKGIAAKDYENEFVDSAFNVGEDNDAMQAMYGH